MSVAVLKEDVIRDTCHPVHRIADKLLPFLRLLVNEFEPEQVFLFGSYAYGNPSADSDVDLLVVKKTCRSIREEATAIRKAFRPLRHSVANLAFDIMVRSPEDLCERLAKGAAFHSEITERGLRLV